MFSQKVLIIILLVLAGSAVFIFGNPYYRIFPTNWNQTYYLSLAIFVLILTIAFNRNPSLSRFSPAAYSFFIAATALVVLKAGFFNLPDKTTNPLQEIAFDKLSQFLHIVPVILVLTLLTRNDLGSIFIQAGRLKQGLIFGLVSFFVFAVISYLINSSNPDFLPLLVKGLPWILLFVFANAIMEELWFRGIFLNQFDALVGRNAAIIITALIFGLSHINATYEFPGGGFVFGTVVFILGIVGAYTMFKDNSLIGPVLFHAGYDLLIIVPIINSL
jgi:membrane protease YdiL (CAAX protease family)